MANVDLTHKPPVSWSSMAERGLALHGRRFAQFSLVGASGVLVNTALLWLLVEAGGLNHLLAAVLATEAAVLSNFTLNDLWTFRHAPPRLSWFRRAVRYNCIALGGLAITVAVLAMLTMLLGLHYLVANLFAIGAATLWNYIANSRFTWATLLHGNSPARSLAPPRNYRSLDKDLENASLCEAPDPPADSRSLSESL